MKMEILEVIFGMEQSYVNRAKEIVRTIIQKGPKTLLDLVNGPLTGIDVTIIGILNAFGYLEVDKKNPQLPYFVPESTRETFTRIYGV